MLAVLTLKVLLTVNVIMGILEMDCLAQVRIPTLLFHVFHILCIFFSFVLNDLYF